MMSRIVCKCRHAVLAAVVLMFSWSASLQAESVVRVSEEPGRFPMVYGFDFERMWHFTSGHADTPREERVYLKDLDELARVAVGEVAVDHIHVAISGAAELEKGKIDWSVYDRQLEMMRAMQRARPDLKFFALPRPIFNDHPGGPFAPYPIWINEFDNPLMEDDDRPRAFLRFHPDRAARYLDRYLNFMREQGFEISYMYIKTEFDRFMRPPETVEVVDLLREKRGDDMPKIILPASHNWRSGAAWIREAMKIDRTDGWDITSTHNTRIRGTVEEFAEVAAQLDKPYWNTELHFWGGPDDKAASNMNTLFEHVRVGFTGFTDWLTLGNERKEHKPLRNIDGRLEIMRIYYIYRHLVNTSANGYSLETNIPDGLTSTVAFIRDDLLTVWALNDTEQVAPDVRIALAHDGARLAEVYSWGPDDPREGTVVAFDEDDAPSSFDLEGKTLYCFSYRL